MQGGEGSKILQKFNTYFLNGPYEFNWAVKDD
jgi:hypothetical protein